MRLFLTHYSSGSIISGYINGQHMGSIYYTNAAHKPLSEIDYKTLIEENNTYKDVVVLDLFNYYLTTRRQKELRK